MKKRSSDTGQQILGPETGECAGNGIPCRASCPTEGTPGETGGDYLGPGRRIRLLKAAYHAARVVLGFTFIYASIHKILEPAAFAVIVHNYRILPEYLVNLTALVLPWLELTLGTLLLMHVWMPGAVSAVTGLLAVFTGTLVFNMARGLDISCGCFSTSSAGNDMNLLTLLRDGGFLALSLFLCFMIIQKRDLPSPPAKRRRRGADPDPGDHAHA